MVVSAAWIVAGVVMSLVEERDRWVRAEVRGIFWLNKNCGEAILVELAVGGN